MSNNKIAEYYVNKYLSDTEIAEHIDAINENKPDTSTLYVCISSGKHIELQSMPIVLGQRDVMRCSEIGYDLAESKCLLFGIYLVEPDEQGLLIEYLTVDGRTASFLLVETKGKKTEPKRSALLEAVISGFMAGYRARIVKEARTIRNKKIVTPPDKKLVIPEEPPKESRIILPGSEQKPGPGKIIIP